MSSDIDVRAVSKFALNNVARSHTKSKLSSQLSKEISKEKHAARILHELRELGASWFGVLTSESQHLPSIIHRDEPLGGVVYGRHDNGFVMMIATDRRLLFLDKKPFFVNLDEINYYFVSGVEFSKSGIGCSVILHTRKKDFRIRTFNHKCAKGFVKYIESRCLEQKDGVVNPELLVSNVL